MHRGSAPLISTNLTHGVGPKVLGNLPRVWWEESLFFPSEVLAVFPLVASNVTVYAVYSCDKPCVPGDNPGAVSSRSQREERRPPWVALSMRSPPLA